jgi:hypothetical protein
MSRKVEYFIRTKNRLSTAIDDLLTDIEMRTIHESVQTNENVQ